MAFEQNIRPISGPAGEDLTSHQWGLVKVGTSGFVKCGAGEQATGVLQNKPGSGQVATVATAGVSVCKAGGAISVDDKVTSDGGGLAVTAGEGDEVIGTAASAAANSGELFELVVGIPTGLVSVGSGEGEGEGEL